MEQPSERLAAAVRTFILYVRKVVRLHHASYGRLTDLKMYGMSFAVAGLFLLICFLVFG